MRERIFCCFLGLVLLLSGAASAFASEDASAAAGTPPASAAEPVFYKISLNETVFIHEREAVVNARVTAEILQGVPERITLEVFGSGSGQGEIFNVSGEKVRDWSLRREGSRTFLEIRPKDLDGVKTFTLTISGRQPIRLPATISPILFSGADSAAFFGLVQFLTTTDLRLYAKQERGLLPIGERTGTGVSYGIVGAPALRLDVARTNDLLAPVSLEDFSLVGDVSASGSRFRMRTKAFVREIGAEAPVLTGDVALLDFPGKTDFVVLAGTGEESGRTEYRLRFPARGEFDVDLQFDAGISDADGWRRMNFSVPVAQVAPYSLKGMPADTVFAADNVSIPQMGADGVFSGFLPSSGALELRWRPSIPTPPEFSASVYALDTATEIQVTTGVLKQRSELVFTISQGELFSLFLETAGTGEILSVEGQDLLAWRQTELDDGTSGVFVQFSQPKTGKYTLRILSQTRAAGAFPSVVRPLRFVPARTDREGLSPAGICVRSGEYLRLRNGVGIRGEAVPQTGMSQVVASAFPQESDFFDKNVAEGEVSVYRLASDSENLRVKVVTVGPDLVVKPRVRWIFDEEKATCVQTISFDARGVPLYEMQIRVPAELELASLDSEIVAGHEISAEADAEGYRTLNLVFSEPVTDEGAVRLTLRRPGISSGEETELRACLFPQAHFVFGVLGLSGTKSLRLLPGASENLTEIAPAEYGSERPPQLAFRIRDAAWKLPLSAEKREPRLRATSSCIYKVEREKILGAFRANYATGGVPAAGVRLAFPPEAKVLAVSGDAVKSWSVDESGTASVELSAATDGDFSVSANFEQPRADGVPAAFEGVRPLDVVSDAGTILITADDVLALSGEESVRTLSALPPEEVDPEDAHRGGAILFRAYQFVERPFSLKLATLLPGKKPMPPIFVKEAIVSAHAGESVGILYRYAASAEAKALRIAVPAGAKIVFDGARTLEDGSVELPLPPNASEIRLRMELPEGSAARREMKILPPRVFAPVARTVFLGNGYAESSTMRVVSSGRVLNDELGAPLFRRFAAKLAGVWGWLAAACLSALCALGGAGIASKARSRRLWFSAALAGVSVFSALIVLSWLSAVRPEYGEAILVAGLTDAGTQLDVALRHFYFFCEHRGEGAFPLVVVATLFFAGFFALLYGKFFFPTRALRRLVGRALIYVPAGIIALEDFPHRVPVFVSALLAAEIFALLAYWLLRGAAKLMNARAALGGAAAFAFAALVPAGALAPEARAETAGTADAAAGVFSGLRALEEEPAFPHDVADRISQAIDVREDRVVARGDIRVTGTAGDRFDLLASPAVLTSFEKAENSMLRLERRRAENSGFVYQVVLERAGTFSANFSYELALSENARGFPLPTGPAAADVATVYLPRSEVQISASGAVTTTLNEFGEKEQIAQIVFKPKAAREVKWNPRERDRSDETPQVFAFGENLYAPAAGVIEGRHAVRFVPAQGEVSSVSLRIPAPFSVSRIEGAAIHRWNFNRRTGVLTVLFTAPRVSEFSLTLFTQAQLGSLPTRQRFEAPEALGCSVQVRTIGIATDDSLQVDAVHADGLVAIDEEEFLAALAAAEIRPEEGLRLRRAFRAVDEKSGFDAELSAVQPNLRVSAKEEYFADGDSVRGEIAFSATVSRAEIFSLTFRVPAATEVESILGDRLSYWTKTREADGSTRVTMHLENALAGTQDFRLRLLGAFPRNAKEWAAPSFVVENAKTQSGEIFVTAAEGLRLSPLSAGTSAFTDDSAAGADERGKTFRFRYHGRGGDSPKFAVLETGPFTTAEWLHKISPRGRYALSEVKMIFDVENVMRDSVRVRVPAEALAIVFSGEEVASAAPVAGTPGAWDVRFYKPVRGKVAVSAEFFTPLPAAATVRVLPVEVESADRRSAWLAVERGGVFAGLASRSPGKASLADVPAELRGELADGGDWLLEGQADKYAAELEIAPRALAAWRDALSDDRRDSFLAEKIARGTVFSREKALTEEKITLKVRRSDVLRIALPEGGALKTVAVNGVPAAVVPAPEVDKRAVWLPIFVRDGADAVVSVVYETPVRAVQRGGRRAFEILPAEIVFAEKIAWTLRPIFGEAEFLRVFGTDAADVLVDEPGGGVAAGTAPAGFAADADFLSAYFPARERAGASADARRTFVADGNAVRAARAVFVAPGTESEPSGYSHAKIFLFPLCALVLVKGLRFLRLRKNSRG